MFCFVSFCFVLFSLFMFPSHIDQDRCYLTFFSCLWLLKKILVPLVWGLYQLAKCELMWTNKCFLLITPIRHSPEHAEVLKQLCLNHGHKLFSSPTWILGFGWVVFLHRMQSKCVQGLVIYIIMYTQPNTEL